MIRDAAMKISDLKLWIREYDNHRGWRRRLLRDALQIQVLKELIRDKAADLNADNDNLEITLIDYQNFAHNKSYNVDLSATYLNSNSASANIFQRWKVREEEQRERISKQFP